MSKPDKKYRVCAGRPYGNDGKKQWVEVGRAVLWDDGGISMEMHAAPVGAWFDGKLSFFDAEEKREGSQGNDRPQQQRTAPTRSQNTGSRSSSMQAQAPADDFSDDNIGF